MYMKSYEELKDFCALMNSILNIPIFFMEDNGILLFEFCENILKNPLNGHGHNIYEDILNCGSEKFPQVLSTKLLENYLVLFIEVLNEKKGYLVFGPSIAHSTKDTADLITDINITFREKASMNKYYASLPVKNYHDLLKLGIFVYFILYKEKIDFESINTTNHLLGNLYTKVENEYKLQYRDINYLRRSSFFERFFFDLIKNGETEKLKELLKMHSLDGEYIVLAKNNPLRSWKNLVICFITISGRAAMEGGLSTEETYAISDVYIQELEDLNTIKDVEDLANKIFIDLSERVNKLKKQQHSKLITQCQSIILKNLSEDLKLTDLAQQLKVNASYLSSLFKKEVGIPLSEYIMKEKISEAKRMLLFTEFTILETYTALGFCDQSHFTKVFKKYTGMTPKHYKNSYSSSTLWD